jgi:hypothetical protein
MVTASVSLLLGIATMAATDRAATPTRWSIDRPRVEVWTNRGEDVATRGDRIRVFVRADRDAFVTVFRVDTDGRVRVLFPREPWEDTFVRRDREYEIEGSGGRDAFNVDDYPGVGYVFAVVSADPFDYNAVVAGDHWDYRLIADGRVRGDPYVALTDLAQRIVPEGYEDWDYDLVPYYVERHYDYPRFACYDCHAYASWTYWDPYAYDCVRFRLVIYDDPWYYPYRYYRGTRVVWVRPYRPPPRYVFKDWGSQPRSREGFITRVRERLGVDTRERTSPIDRPAPGAIPAPRTRDRTSPALRIDERAVPDRRDRSDQPVRRERQDRNQDQRQDQPDRSDRGASGSRSTPAPPLSAPRTTERATGRPRESVAPDKAATPSREPGRIERAMPDRGTTTREQSRGSDTRSERGTTTREQSRGSDSRSARESPSTRRDTPARSETRGQERRTEPRDVSPSSGSRGSRSQPEARTAPRSGGERSTGGSSSRGGGDRPAGGRSAEGGGSRSSGGSPSRGGGSGTPELKRRKP